MSKVLLAKRALFFTFFILIANSAIGQESFSMRGQFLIDKKVVIGAVVTVYEGKNIVTQAATNKLGKFWVDLHFQKTYVLQFKKQNMPLQKVVISTKSGDLGSDFSKSKVVVFALSSKKQSKEGPDPGDAVTSFHLNKNGMLEQKHVLAEVKPIEISEEDVAVIDEIDEEIEDLENEIEVIITETPDSIRASEWGQYDILRQKKDSVILLAEKKAQIILNSAQRQSDKISKEAIKKAAKSTSAKKNITSSEDKIKNDLKKLAIKEKSFLEREDIKNYRTNINKFNKKGRLSIKDSLEYLNDVVSFNEEMVKSARLQLEIDK